MFCYPMIVLLYYVCVYEFISIRGKKNMIIIISIEISVIDNTL